MFCRQCGKEISNDAKFCEQCGYKLDNATLQEQNTSSVLKKLTIIVLMVTIGAFAANQYFKHRNFQVISPDIEVVKEQLSIEKTGGLILSFHVSEWGSTNEVEANTLLNLIQKSNSFDLSESRLEITSDSYRIFTRLNKANLGEEEFWQNKDELMTILASQLPSIELVYLERFGPIKDDLVRIKEGAFIKFHYLSSAAAAPLTPAEFAKAIDSLDKMMTDYELIDTYAIIPISPDVILLEIGVLTTSLETTYWLDKINSDNSWKKGNPWVKVEARSFRVLSTFDPEEKFER